MGGCSRKGVDYKALPMKAVFLSDAHLKRFQDPGYRALIDFLGRLKNAGDRGKTKNDPSHAIESPSIPVTDLFLAGDIFDFWFSKKMRIYPHYEEIVGRFVALKEQGVAIHFCEGNHDFFLKGYFSDRQGMTVYEDWAVIEDGGRKILLSHGDLVDSSNIRYLKLRKTLRSPLLYQLQRLLPLAVLWGIARGSSSVSKEYMNGAEEKIAQTMRRFAHDKFQEGFDAVILGHCHRPLLEESMMGGKPRVFVTLGDWVRHNSYLYYDEGRFSLNHH